MFHNLWHILLKHLDTSYPFLAKMKMCHPLMGHLPPNHDVGRVMASLHPQNVFLHLMGYLKINLVLLVVLLLDADDFLVHEGMFLCLYTVCHWRRLLLIIGLPSEQD